MKKKEKWKTRFQGEQLIKRKKLELEKWREVDKSREKKNETLNKSYMK